MILYNRIYCTYCTVRLGEKKSGNNSWSSRAVTSLVGVAVWISTFYVYRNEAFRRRTTKIWRLFLLFLFNELGGGRRSWMSDVRTQKKAPHHALVHGELMHHDCHSNGLNSKRRCVMKWYCCGHNEMPWEGATGWARFTRSCAPPLACFHFSGFCFTPFIFDGILNLQYDLQCRTEIRTV